MVEKIKNNKSQDLLRSILRILGEIYFYSNHEVSRWGLLCFLSLGLRMELRRNLWDLK